MPGPPQVVTHTLTIAATGASGALRVFAEELEISGRSGLVEKLLSRKSSKICQQNNDDIGANIASGSYPTTGMIVLPCSMGTLAGISQGLARNLIERAADVCLKEKRPLVLCVRETPLNRVHLRNMNWAAEAGATIYPLIPTFYNHPRTLDDMAHQFACRVLAFIGLPQDDAYVWGK
jgi:flavin prenyltransferase